MTSERREFARSLRKMPTKAEDILWQALRGRKLAGLKFKRQVPFLSYTVDFLCFDCKLIVEVDGVQHGWYADYDATRTREIEDHGFTLVRVVNADVRNDIDAVRLRILKAARIPAAPNPSPGRERGRGEGERVEDEAPRPPAAHPHPRPLSHPGEGRRGGL